MPTVDVLAQFRSRRLWFIADHQFELTPETIRIVERVWFRRHEIEIGIEGVPNQKMVMTRFSVAAAAAGALILAGAVALFAVHPGERWLIALLGAALFAGSVAVLINSIRSWAVARSQIANLVIPFRGRERADMESFLTQVHEAKLRLISRRIKTVGSIIQVEEMYKRLSWYVDNRILTQQEFERFNELLTARRIQVG